MHINHDRRTPVMLLASPFRLFFLAAALAALLPVTGWLLLYLGVPVTAVTPQWHAHELLFGMVPAAAAGFLLTAVANWTNSQALHGKGLLLLFLLWLAGRVLLLLDGLGGLPGSDSLQILVLAIDLAFLPMLLLLVALPVIRSGNRRQWVLLLVLLLWSLLHFYAHAFGTELWPLQHTHASHITLDVLLLLIVLIGSRIIPMFTRNALQRAGGEAAVVRDPKPLLLASMLLGAALILSTMWQPDPLWRALVAAALGLVLLLRLGFWQGWRAWRDPLVWMLHMGIFWLALALAVAGGGTVSTAAGQHGLSRAHRGRHRRHDSGHHHARTAGAYRACLCAAQRRRVDLLAAVAGSGVPGIRRGAGLSAAQPDGAGQWRLGRCLCAVDCPVLADHHSATGGWESGLKADCSSLRERPS